MDEKLTSQQLKSFLWDAANILRGKIDSGDFKHYIFGLLFFKRLSDVFDEEYQKMVGTVGEELAKSKYFEPTDVPGPDTLIIRGAMLDIVSRIPPEMSVGMHEIYVSTFGEVTLVLEIVDSMSGEVLARAAERRALTPVGGGLGIAVAPTVWAEVRRVARRWGSLLRDGMDSFHEI